MLSRLDLSSAIQRIKELNPKVVTLQLPDSYIQEADEIKRQICEVLYEDSRVFYSIDNCKNSCCVDYHAPKHVNSDLIIKFGESCLCEESKIETIYVPEKANIDIEKLAQSLDESSISSKQIYVDLFNNLGVH